MKVAAKRASTVLSVLIFHILCVILKIVKINDKIKQLTRVSRFYVNLGLDMRSSVK